jgi:hypothetical protein
MRRLGLVSAIAIVMCAVGSAQTPGGGPYKVLKTAKVGGAGGFDYVNADVDGRRLYVARRADQPSGQPARINVFNLDTLAPVGELTNVSAHGAAFDPKSGHGFASSKPVTMFDTKTLAVIKTIDVQGSPDGLLFDPFNQRLHVLSHAAPNDTVINTVDGTVVGTIDLGGAPEQAATDGKGHIYVDLEDKDAIALVDAQAMTVTGKYDISSVCGGPGGLGFDAKNHILFPTCGDQAKQNMAVVNSDTGKIITSFPIGAGTDGGGFNPNTMEAFSSNGDGTLTIVKENSPTSFAVEQNLKTMPRAKTMTIDTKTNQILLIAAEYAPAPAPATPPPAGAAGRGRSMMVPDSFSVVVVGK